MKAILVIDLPNDVKIEDVGITYIVQEWNGILVKAQVEHIPLKPMPEKYEVKKASIKDKGREEKMWVLGTANGWNACLEELEK